MKENQAAYKHDFDDGEYAPGKPIDSNLMAEFYPQMPFSVGIFIWLPKVSGKGLKRSKVKYRIKGKMADSEKIYERAKEMCKHLDNLCEKWNDPFHEPAQKSETIK